MASATEGLSRRLFMQKGSRTAAGLMAGALAFPQFLKAAASAPGEGMRFGLVTYQWGRDWDLPTLLRNCARAGAYGVELRVEHDHRVDPSLNARQREEVRLRFENSPVELVGFGTNYAFHYADKDQVRQEIEGAKAYVRLSREVGGSGVKVKPNGLPDGAPVEQTIEQIGQALNELGRFAEDFGQEIRVEVHGEKTQNLPVMKQIFDVATHPNVGACWNCNPQDLEAPGLAHNFNLIKDRLARTVHVRELDDKDYPYQQLFSLLSGIGYEGWILLEARTEPMDRVQALAEQHRLFEQMVPGSQAQAG